MNQTDEVYRTLDEYIQELYKQALRCKIKPFEFWELTIQEIIDMIEAYNEVQKEEMQFQAICAYSTAHTITQGIAVAFGKEKFPQLHEVFPSLFEKPKPVQQYYRKMHAIMMAYNEAWKKQNN